jgi:VIT1/CCC1 family predicted Fe2+/Mn2+ transporter
MPDDHGRSTKRVLDPIDRISEILFGLIMVLTFTGSLSATESGRDDVRTMLIGALGCNLAWGIIDAAFYLMGCLAEKSRNLATYRAVRGAADAQEAQRLIADALPPRLAAILTPEEFQSMRRRLMDLPPPPARAHLHREDWLGALGVFLLVSLSILPIAVPFVFIADIQPALRASNAVAVVLMFVVGYAFGRMTGRRPWAVGLAMVVVGALLVALTIALGG